MTGLIDFSTDAASNDVAAPPILFVEGQPAKTVNDSMRALMAALANWRDDNTGVLVASRGAADAYQIATSQGFSDKAVANPHTVSFRVTTANTGPTTLSLDGRAALPLVRGQGRQLGPGDLAPGITYSVSRTPGTDAYVVVAPTIARPGKIEAQAHDTFDPGWLPCDGRAVSRTSYAALFLAIGTKWGAGDGTTTFNLPKMNGRTMFGADDLGGTAANVLTGAGGLAGALGSVGGAQTVTLTAAQIAPHAHAGTTGADGAHDHGGVTGNSGSHNHGGTTLDNGAHSHGGVTAGAGSHSHSATLGAGGEHGHNIKFAPQAVYGAGASTAVTNIGPAGSNASTDTAGNHSHTLSIDSVGDHAHGLTINGVGNHAHGISTASDHTHTINAAATHTHTLTTDVAGEGAAHANMPPGIVVAFAIKA